MSSNTTNRSKGCLTGCSCLGGIAIVAVLVLLVVVSTVAALAGMAWARADTSNAGEYAFDNPLHVPPLLEADIDENGRKVFDLTFTEGESELLPGKTTETWGLNGPYLSPTVRASRGDEVVMNVHNGVDETTTLHWHGMHLPAAMDGGPHQMVEPGETWSPTWTVDQPAATLWFHPHPHGRTAEHVYRGAAGMFIIDDPALEDLAIPSDYGVDDIPLIIQDKQLHSDGSLDFGGGFMRDIGILGDEILVNGTHAPSLEATTSLVRFRVLNASNARVYNLGFDDDREYFVIGSDTGLLEQPVPLTRLQLSPGERAEIVVEVEPGDDVMLRSFAPDLDMDFWSERMNGGDDDFDILRVTSGSDIAESPELPDQLVAIDRPDEADATTTRSFQLQGNSRINGEAMDMSRVDDVITVDTTEIWEISNNSGTIHNFHAHLIHFAILEIDGEEPPPHLRGWKDTVFLPRGSSVWVIAEFKDYVDPDVPYMYHCHILRHEDNGMMGQFVVVEPGTEVSGRLHTDHEHDHD